ncbi:MAG: hypothetical protein ABH834_07895 [Candidatus Altiarchaeota archaeon]
MTAELSHELEVIDRSHKTFFLLTVSGIVFLLVQYLYSYYPMNLNAVLSLFFALGILVFYHSLKNISWLTTKITNAHTNPRIAVKGEQLMFLHYTLSFILLSFMVDISPSRINALATAALTLVAAAAILQALTHTYIFTRFCVATLQVAANKK